MKNSTNKKSVGKEDSSEEFRYEIINHIGILGTNNSGWKKEINIVKWNDANPKIDIREWDQNHEKMSRGTSLNFSEAENLRNCLLDLDFSVLLNA